MLGYEENQECRDQMDHLDLLVLLDKKDILDHPD